MSNRTVNIGAGETKDFRELGDFLRILDAVGTISIWFYFQGREVSSAESVNVGYSEKFETSQFDAVKIYSATAQAVQVGIRLGNTVGYDKPPVGNVAITNTGGAFAQAQATVTNVTTTQKAANAVRRYFFFQNNDAAGIVYLTLDGTAATVAKGIKIAPGGSIELQGFVPTGAVNAIGSIASNANCTIVEG